jgi:hypothetical protein
VTNRIEPEVTAMSGLRVLDVAHRVVAELGDWQYHPALVITSRTDLAGAPDVEVRLTSKSTVEHRVMFLDDLAVVLGTTVYVWGRQDGSRWSRVDADDWRGSGVSVSCVLEVSR